MVKPLRLGPEEFLTILILSPIINLGSLIHIINIVFLPQVYYYTQSNNTYLVP